MKVRTCSGHVAGLSAAPGSGSRSRTQVGYLIARSGIPDGRTAYPAD
ncbi:LuxR family transcriptional regulator [Streptomyces anulatus]